MLLHHIQKESIPEKFEQVLKRLHLPACTKTFEHMDAHRAGVLTASERTEDVFDEFKEDLLGYVEELSEDLPHLKAIEQWGDLSSMTFEQFEDNNVNSSMATLICDFVKIVAEKCILCDDEILGVVNAARRSFNLNHEIQGGKKTSKLKGNPFEIARDHGAIETRNAVEEHMLTNQCNACHARDVDAHEARGNDDDDKFAPRSFGSTPPTIEEAMTPQVRYVVCTHLRLLMYTTTL